MDLFLTIHVIHQSVSDFHGQTGCLSLGEIPMKTEAEIVQHAPGVSIKGVLGKTVRIGFGRPMAMRMEVPAQIREGTYDVERLGAFTYAGGGSTVLRHVASIGRFCLIAGNVTAGSVEHPLDLLSPHPMFAGQWDREWPQLADFYAANAEQTEKTRLATRKVEREKFTKITIGNDVWIGEGVSIRRGVTIGDGAVIATRSYVNRDVPPYMIVGGSPARPIRMRFPQDVVDRLMMLRWWDYGLSALQGVDITNIEAALDQIEANISSGRAVLYDPQVVELGGA